MEDTEGVSSDDHDAIPTSRRYRPFPDPHAAVSGSPGAAQDTPSAAVSDPCLAAAGTETPWPIGPGMMLTPGARAPGMMGPGMMTPGTWGPAMMGDVDLMVATMLLAHDRVD